MEDFILPKDNPLGSAPPIKQTWKSARQKSDFQVSSKWGTMIIEHSSWKRRGVDEMIFLKTIWWAIQSSKGLFGLQEPCSVFGVMLSYLGFSWCSMLANRCWNPISTISRVRRAYSFALFLLFRSLPAQTESSADMDYHPCLYSFCFRRAFSQQLLADEMLTIWRIESAMSGTIFSHWLALHPMGCWCRTFLLTWFSLWSSLRNITKKGTKYKNK